MDTIFHHIIEMYLKIPKTYLWTNLIWCCNIHTFLHIFFSIYMHFNNLNNVYLCQLRYISIFSLFVLYSFLVFNRVSLCMRVLIYKIEGGIHLVCCLGMCEWQSLKLGSIILMIRSYLNSCESNFAFQSLSSLHIFIH